MAPTVAGFDCGPGRPGVDTLVFSGSVTTASGWRAVNASLRARSLGYTQVLWYRGGLEAWLAANLPTANGIVRAVAD